MSYMINPFTNEDQKILENIDNDINLNRSKESWSYFTKWIRIYFKYCNKVSESYLQFKIYDILYDEETSMFEKELLELMNKYVNILDFGCGTCKIWRKNPSFYINKTVHCIDLYDNVLAYPKFLLKNESKYIYIST